MRRVICQVAGAVALLTLPATAHAHPHVWIGASVQFDMKDGKIVSVTQRWEFDHMFGAMLAHTFDANKDKKLQKPEIALMRKKAFRELRNYSYFTHLRIDGKEHKIKEATAFTASLNEGRVVYQFTIKLPRPVDPRREKADFRFVDMTYYVDVSIKSLKHIKIAGKGASACKFKVEKDTKNPIYYGMVVPEMILINCADA